MSNFTHLHLHTQYSLLDGANIIPDLVKFLKQDGMKACAISDHGWMAGVIEFYKECTKNDIKPLLGVEAYITEDVDGKDNSEKNRDNMHMVLIAKDNAGYSKLLKLCSEAALDNFYYKPRIYKSKLESLAGHVVATSACLGGIIAKKCEFIRDEYGRAKVCQEPFKKAIEVEIDSYRQMLGEDFYLEIQSWDSGDHFQPEYNKFIIKTATEMSVPIVITADAHYLKLQDEKLHELLMAMQLGMTVKDYVENSEMLYGPNFYVADQNEMLNRAKKWNCEEAYYNTYKIAEKCNVEIELGKYKTPKFDITEADDYQEFLKWKAIRTNSPKDCSCHSGIPMV